MKNSFHVSPHKPWVLLISLYITQYIGVAFFFSSTVVILRDIGLALDKIALLNIIAIPLLFKVFFAPFIDSISVSLFGYKLQGKYRGWLLVSQFMMVVLLVVIGSMNILNQFGLTLGLMTLYVVVTSFQDIAVDGISFKLFNKEERQYVNSLQFSGNLLGNIIGGGIILIAYSWLQWRGSLWLIALITTISWFQLLAFVETISEPDSLTSSPTKTLITDKLVTLSKLILRFIKHNKTWICILMIYPLGMSLGFALINPLLVDADWSKSEIGIVMKLYGSIVGILSAIMASYFINKLKRNKALLTFTALQALAMLTFLPLSYGHTGKLMVYISVGSYFAIYPALMTTIATIIMDKASTQHAKATFFTLQIGLMTFMGFVYAGLSLVLAKLVGYSIVIIISSMLILGMLVFVNYFYIIKGQTLLNSLSKS